MRYNFFLLGLAYISPPVLTKPLILSLYLFYVIHAQRSYSDYLSEAA